MEIKFSNEFTDSTYIVTPILESQILSPINNNIVTKISSLNAPVENAYLILVITRPNNTDIIKWKISIDRVILTREFKPHIDISINNKYIQSVFIYDISKILRNDSYLKISYEGKNHIRIDTATLLSIYRYKGFHVYLDCIVDICKAENIQKSVENLARSFNPNNIRINTGLVAERITELSVSTSNSENITTYKLVPGFNIVELNISPEKIPAIINIGSKDELTRHIFTCTFLSYEQQPRLFINKIDINEDKLLLTISNIGDSLPDKSELVILRYGVPLQKIDIEPIKPGEKSDITVDTKAIGRYKNVVLRLIWYKAFKIYYDEKTIKLP
ncbi:hypothetical protein Igag_0085 [Ignisphaera aggregans DSM 17230]|uniref:Uncharacterized protein n=1 Tax=Ignisphaera aggregans (strain DSM 17230 / JCM 13409 / AQ1.S1) TaxID=583356 RepID=E0SPJ4_IGNAA|nr:hypothetical protein Igag_0085 [Ignisphaera aggregans DSM 17230]